MNAIKKIKFIGPFRIAAGSKDEFMTKLKPVLGQNQISLPNFITEYNKAAHFLSDTISGGEIRAQIIKSSDKSFKVVLLSPSINMFTKQLVLDNNNKLDVKKFQDIIRLKMIFQNKIGAPNNSFQTIARIFLSNLSTNKVSATI